MTVLITGAAGLVGHAVRRRLEADGVAVVPLDVVARSHDGVEQVACDLLDPVALDGIIASARPTAIVHAGGISGPMVAADDPVQVVRANVEGTTRLLESARRHGVTRVVYCSSIAAYGATAADVVGEETPLHPTEVYGATKAAGEHLLEAYRHHHRISTASLRLVAVFGPRRRTDCLIRRLLLDAAAGRSTRVALPADAPQQYVYVDDVADAVVAAVHREHAVGAYNITGRPGTLTVAELVAAVQAAEPGVRADIDPADASAAARWPGRLDAGAAGRELGYTARHELTEAVRTYRDRLDEVVSEG